MNQSDNLKQVGSIGSVLQCTGTVNGVRFSKCGVMYLVSAKQRDVRKNKKKA